MKLPKPAKKLQKIVKPVSNVAVRIEGKVAYADQTRVLLNVGSSDNVSAGMILKVYHIIEEVKDPDTTEILDVIEEPVAEIRVTQVQEKSSTCVIQKSLSTRYAISVGDNIRNFNK